MINQVIKMAEETEIKETKEEEREKLKHDRCRIALDAALRISLEECGGKEELLKHIGEVLGLTEKEIEALNPLSEHCRRVLGEALTKERCLDFIEQRRWVMCRVWDLMETEHLPFRSAVKRAWSELKERCSKLGAYI